MKTTLGLEGGTISTILMHYEVRLPTGEVFNPWHVTGYVWRVNNVPEDTPVS